jgi:hypothetical protein
MMETETKEAGQRQPISVTLPGSCIAWLDRKVESRAYASRSHGIELLILNEITRQSSPSAGATQPTPVAFSVEREFKISPPEAIDIDGPLDLEHRFLKAMCEAWDFGARAHVLRVAVKGCAKPRLFYRLRNLGTTCDANSTRQEYLAVDESLQIVRLVVMALRDPAGMSATLEAEQKPLTAEQAKQLGFTHDQMVAEVERFLSGDAL